MTVHGDLPDFGVISGATVHGILAGRHQEVLELIEKAYILHGSGDTTNPASYFLRFPDKPSARIIALPAAVRGQAPIDGLKWVSSFPTNLSLGIPRASAVLLLNDPETGYPMACLEGSIISAVRTAASAALAARQLTRPNRRPTRVGFIGTGLIARYLHDYLSALPWEFEQLGVYDLSPDYAADFAGYLEGMTSGAEVRVFDCAAELIKNSDLVVFATTAPRPHLTDPALFAHHPLVLHVSLRDLDPAVILDSVNIVDDIDHVLHADTSVHLAEQQTGRRDFIDATLHDVITGSFEPPRDRTIVFSPFGLGILDLVVGEFVHRQALESASLQVVENFFHDTDRYSAPPRITGTAAGEGQAASTTGGER